MNNKLLKKTTLTNQDTGEYTSKISFVDMQFNEDGYLFFKNRFGTKSYLDIHLPDSFTWADKGRIEELRHYILKDNQLLVHRSGNVIKPLLAFDIAKVISMSERQCKTFINKLKKHKVIKEVKIGDTTYYCYNPIYGMKDKRMSMIVFIIFQDELREWLPSWAYMRFVEEAQEITPTIKIVK